MAQVNVFDGHLKEYIPRRCRPTSQEQGEQSLLSGERTPAAKSAKPAAQLDPDWWLVDEFSHDFRLAHHLEDDRSTDASSLAGDSGSAHARGGADAEHGDLLAGRVERVEVRVERPLQNMITLFETKNYDPIVAEHKRWFQRTCDDPVASWRDMRSRLDARGETASFRAEFEGTVAFLTKKLFQERQCAAWFRSAGRRCERDQLIASLAGVQIETRFMFPYRRTLEVIRTMISLIDVYYRTHLQADLVPYYHNFRYDYYMTLLTDVTRNDVVLVPTVAYVGATALLKLRCAPLHVLGVVDAPTYADQYLNSPLDFFAHDVNHARRTMLETERYYDTFVKHREYYRTRNYWTNVSKEQWYAEMHEFTRTCVLPMVSAQKGDPEEVLAKKALKRILAFEITHEKAWPMCAASVLRNIVMGHDAFPVESLVAEDGVIRTKDFAFNDPTTLANCIGKLRGGFYDDPRDPNRKIVPAAARTSRQLAGAALEMYCEIKQSGFCTGSSAPATPSLRLLEALATDPHDTTEFRDVATIVTPDDARVAYPVSEAFEKPRPEHFIPGWDEEF